MAQHYSNHFESTNGTTVTAREAGYIPIGGINGEVLNIAGARIRSLSLTTDTMRMIRGMPSNARIWELNVSDDNAAAAGAAYDIGVHDIEANGGAVVDQDRFATAQAKNANHVDVFNEVTTPLKNSDRGKFLWELLGLTVDPQKQYDITITPSTSFTAAAMQVTLIAKYTLG